LALLKLAAVNFFRVAAIVVWFAQCLIPYTYGNKGTSIE